MTIELEDGPKGGRAYVGSPEQPDAQMTFSRAGENLLIIDHTEVGDQLRGQGVGRQLVYRVVNFAREQGIRILPLCPFAKSVFDKEPEIGDVLRGAA